MAFCQSGAEFLAAGSNMANTTGQWAASNNPACIPDKHNQIGFFGANRFSGTSIVNGGLAAAHATETGTVGLLAAYQGTEFFNRRSILASFGKKINSNLSAGISLGYTSIFQGANYHSVGRLIGKVGLKAQITDKWCASAVLSNPWVVKDYWLNTQNKTDIALNYLANKNTTVGGIFSFPSTGNAVYGISLQHRISEKFNFTSALKSGNELLSAGISFVSSHFLFQFATAYHVTLGFAPGFTLLWQK